MNPMHAGRRRAGDAPTGSGPIPLALAAGLAVLFAGPALAATWCVDTLPELQTAIDAAEGNGEDDEIRIASGTYASSTPFHFQSSEVHAIAFAGGYSASCTEAGGEPTTIDGENARRGLFVLNPDGDIAVERLTFVRGLSTNNRGGGLRAASESGDIRIDGNVFLANRADDFAGAARVVTETGTLRVRNNLAFANSAANVGAFELTQQAGTGYVSGNTITVNSSEGDFLPGGLYVGGAAHFVVSNNIVWNNLPEQPGPFHNDFQGAASHDRYSNDIGVVSSNSVDGEVVGELGVDPQFADCGFLCIGFELERGSPLVDAGIDDPAGGPTVTDLAGKPRTIGPHVDIGAYENDLLFADGFD
jgi:hypothetical protein